MRMRSHMRHSCRARGCLSRQFGPGIDDPRHTIGLAILAALQANLRKGDVLCVVNINQW